MKKWLSKNVPLISKWQVEDLINPYSDKFYNNDANLGGKFISTNIPYGRVNAFLNYHGLSIEDEPVYYSAQRSKNDIRRFCKVSIICIRKHGLCFGYTRLVFYI